eukprot:Nk52_evm28s2402 gene=Nk52_evmTU28s2402
MASLTAQGGSNDQKQYQVDPLVGKQETKDTAANNASIVGVTNNTKDSGINNNSTSNNNNSTSTPSEGTAKVSNSTTTTPSNTSNTPNTNTNTSANSSPATGKKKKTRVLASVSCVACKTAHRACRGGRPCERCIKYGIADKCRDSVQKKRGPVLKRLDTSGYSLHQRPLAPATLSPSYMLKQSLPMPNLLGMPHQHPAHHHPHHHPGAPMSAPLPRAHSSPVSLNSLGTASGVNSGNLLSAQDDTIFQFPPSGQSGYEYDKYNDSYDVPAYNNGNGRIRHDPYARYRQNHPSGDPYGGHSPVDSPGVYTRSPLTGDPSPYGSSHHSPIDPRSPYGHSPVDSYLPHALERQCVTSSPMEPPSTSTAFSFNDIPATNSLVAPYSSHDRHGSSISPTNKHLSVESLSSYQASYASNSPNPSPVPDISGGNLALPTDGDNRATGNNGYSGFTNNSNNSHQQSGAYDVSPVLASTSPNTVNANNTSLSPTGQQNLTAPPHHSSMPSLNNNLGFF